MTECWKSVVGYEGVYEVSDLGNVRSLDRIDAAGHRLKARTIRTSKNRGGYHVICLSKDGRQKTVTLHSVVLTAFVGPRPDGMFGCHGDDCQDNNSLSNLRWDTPSANGADKVRNGRSVTGSRHHRSKLTEDQVTHIRETIGSISGYEMARIFGVTPSTISSIRNNRTRRVTA